MNHIDQIKAYYGKTADWEAGEKGEKKSGPGVGKGEGSDVPDGEGNTAKRASEDVSGPFRTRVTHVVTAADLYVAVSGKKLLGATDGAHGSSKSGWKGVERVRKAPSYEILKVKNVPQNVAVNMVDWGSNNPKTSFWKDEETAYKAVERYLKKGEKVAADTETDKTAIREKRIPKGDFAIIISKGMDDFVASVHKTEAQAIEVLKRKHGIEPGPHNPMGAPKIVDVSRRGPWEIIPYFGKLTVRPKRASTKTAKFPPKAIDFNRVKDSDGFWKHTISEAKKKGLNFKPEDMGDLIFFLNMAADKWEKGRKASTKTAGVLRYEGDTPLDKVYAMSDLLKEVGKGLPTGATRSSEVSAVQKSLYKLESFVEKQTKKASLQTEPTKTAADIDAAYTAAIVKELKRMAGSLGIAKMKQKSKGSGGNSARRQIQLDFADAPMIDLWVGRRAIGMGPIGWSIWAAYGTVRNWYDEAKAPLTGDLRQDVRAISIALKEYVETAAGQEGISWRRASTKTAGNAGGLYGFPKALQNDCDVASRRVAKAAVRIAKAAYKKDARVAEFLSTHAKRSKSVPAKALVAAFAEMGPKIASSDAERLQELRDKQASTNKEAKLAYGLYGYYDKTSRLGLNACAELRHEAGVVASNLHRRRAAKHARISEYLSTHCKKARCAYSRLILDGYPEAEMRLASETPNTIDEWISWED